MIQVQTIVHRVFAHRGKERIGLSLALHAQDHHYIGIDDRVFDSSFEAHALLDYAREFRRHQRARAGNADARA